MKPQVISFALTLAEEARAAKLHSESVIVDLASQYAGGNIFAEYPPHLQEEFRLKMAASGSGFECLAESIYWPFEMSKTGRSQLIQTWLLDSGLSCVPYDVPVHDGYDPLARKWEELTSKYADLPWLRYVTTASEIRQAKRDRLLAFYGFWQPYIPAPRDLQALDTAYAKGLRSFMLTYNRMDHIGVGCTERVDAGLSMYGVDVVRHCESLGIIVDVSHCGHLTTLDACRHAKKPVNANHTAAQGRFFSARGKRDEALRAIAATGGVIGVAAVPAFLTDVINATIEHMLDHIDYIADLVGWRHVALGTDWPMQAPDDILQATLAAGAHDLGFRSQDRLDVTKRLVGFDDCRDLPNITRGLVKRGYADDEIRGILGENAIRVFTEVWGS